MLRMDRAGEVYAMYASSANSSRFINQQASSEASPSGQACPPLVDIALEIPSSALAGPTVEWIECLL